MSPRPLLSGKSLMWFENWVRREMNRSTLHGLEAWLRGQNNYRPRAARTIQEKDIITTMLTEEIARRKEEAQP